jgi:hypothetical protein
MSACASQCRFCASGIEGAGMARSSVAAVMSFWLARGGVLGLLTSKSALMRSRAYLPSSHARSPRVEASPAMEVRSSRTARYSSASLASSSRAWASCALMSAPLASEVGARLAPCPGVVQFPGSGGLLRHQPLPRSRCSPSRRLLTVNSCIKVRLDLQADKSPVVVKGPFFPRVVNPRYRIRGTMCKARIQSSKARKAIL